MVTIKRIKLLLALALGLSVTACGEKKDDESDTEDAEEDPAGTIAGAGGGSGSGSGSGSGTSEFSVIGAWEATNCVAASLKLQSESEEGGEDGEGGEGGGGNDDEGNKEVFAFAADGALKVTITMYDEKACSTPRMQLAIDGKYALGKEVAAEPPTKELDFEITGGTITILNAEAVTHLNSEEGEGSFCQKDTDWVLNEAVSITDLDCGNMLPTIGEKIYDIVSVSDDVLRMGSKEEDVDGDTPETRPTILGKTDEEKYVKLAE